MEWIKKNWFPIVIILIAALAVSGVYIYHQQQMLKLQKAQSEYERQLKGQLSDDERKIEEANTELGLAQAKLVSQGDLEKDYKAQLDAKDKALEAFRKEHNLQIKSLTDEIYALNHVTHGGTTHTEPSVPLNPTTNPVAATQPATQPGIAYTYEDPYKRVFLHDPDIFIPGNEELRLTQSFRIQIKVFQQKNGQLQAQQTTLTEVVKQPDGTYKPLGDANLVDANFTYSPSTLPPTPAKKGVDLSVMATIGSTFVADSPLAFGGSVNIIRYNAWGIAAGIISDFQSRAGTSPDVFLTYRPHIAGRDTNFMIGAGAAFPLGGTYRVVPTANLSFVVW